MPIVDIRYVASESVEAQAPSAQELADALGKAVGSPPGKTWVRLHPHAGALYAENEVLLEEVEYPVFVTVLLARLPSAGAKAAQVRAITAAVATCFGRPEERVHVEYAPAAAGRLAFGGKLVE